MSWKIVRSDSFIKDLKKISKLGNVLISLKKVFEKLQDNPLSLGKILSGPLHPARRIRIDNDYRLIYDVDKKNKTVYLLAINRRKVIYK